MKEAIAAALVWVLAGCATRFPENPTPDELNEMHGIMEECLNGIIPLETDCSRKCRSVEDALIEYYGSLNAFLDAHRNRE